jgi:hypothetical protein
VAALYPAVTVLYPVMGVLYPVVKVLYPAAVVVVVTCQGVAMVLCLVMVGVTYRLLKSQQLLRVAQQLLLRVAHLPAVVHLLALEARLLVVVAQVV